jgi:two-component system response regulator
MLGCVRPMDHGLPVEILLVEDSATDLELAVRALKKARLGNRIEVARDGQEALDFVFARNAHAGRSIEDKPRLVLLDLKLPKVDGLDVLRAIKGDARTRSIPVVILTSSREQRDVVESYDLGVNSYIVKPVDFEGFSAAVIELGMYWLVHNVAPSGVP